MEKQKELMGPFEQLVLTAIVALGKEAYGLAIQERVQELANRSVRVGAVYMTLVRMEEKGYVTSKVTAGTPERGDRTRNCYELTPEGGKAYRESVETAKRITETADAWLKKLGKRR